MNDAVKCLCGAEPVIERMPNIGNVAIEELFKYRCPNCKEKELPWMGQWHDCGALQEWNRIARKRSYRKRTLEYNDSGMCVSPPFKTIEWVNEKKAYEKVTIGFYLDNSMYYFCFDYNYMNHGFGFMVSIGSHGYPSLEIAKKAAMKKMLRSDKSLKKILDALLLPKQRELFG